LPLDGSTLHKRQSVDRHTVNQTPALTRVKRPAARRPQPWCMCRDIVAVGCTVAKEKGKGRKLRGGGWRAR
jgi:hypothetical protein